MKKKIYIALTLLLVSGGFFSCRKSDELPPLDRGYAKDVILPDPEDLTRADREYLEELEEEYNNSLN